MRPLFYLMIFLFLLYVCVYLLELMIIDAHIFNGNTLWFDLTGRDS